MNARTAASLAVLAAGKLLVARGMGQLKTVSGTSTERSAVPIEMT